MENLSHIQFKYFYDHTYDHHVIAAYKPENKSSDSVATLGWIGHDYAKQHGLNPGVIHTVSVDEPHRRQGIATGMLQEAQKVAKDSNGEIPMPKHASRLSVEGKAWKKSFKQPKA